LEGAQSFFFPLSSAFSTAEQSRCLWRDSIG